MRWTARRRGGALAASAVVLAPVALGAQRATADTTPRITVGAFVDAYYAWDVGRPPSFDRSFAGGTLFTTQPARHNEFNINLAFIDVKLDAPDYRGRLALQTGTSVQSNYSGEPVTGQVSGPSLSRMIQEATAGVKLADGVWIDGGIFFSHLGTEGWISRDNPIYTRSLVADYSPYYQAGVKFTWSATAKLTAQLDVVNGWQTIAENNSGKGAGIRLDYAATPMTTVSYFNFFSDESGNRLRTYDGVGVKATRGRWGVLAEADVGSQSASSSRGGTAAWYGATAILRSQLSPALALVGRVERFDDRDQVIVATGSAGVALPNGPLRATGASIGMDVSPRPRVLWRSEARGFANRSPIFPDGRTGPARRTGGFVVSSLALTI